MVCGLCHREDQDLAESTSGPTRCKYQTHRSDCPGGFRTACDLHLEQLKEPKLEDEPKVDIKPGEHLGQVSPDDLAGKLKALLSPQQLEALLHPEGKPQLVEQTPKNPQNLKEVSSRTPQTLHAGLPPNLISGFDTLARQHVADNHKHLLARQTSRPPTLALSCLTSGRTGTPRTRCQWS